MSSIGRERLWLQFDNYIINFSILTSLTYTRINIYIYIYIYDSAVSVFSLI